MYVTNKEQYCNVTLPESARVRWSGKNKSNKGGPLQAKFRVRIVSKADSSMIGPVVTEIPFMLTTMVERESNTPLWNSEPGRARKLLEESSTSEKKTDDDLKHTHLPYLKYGSQPILIRYVAEERAYGGPPYVRNDGVKLFQWNQSTYRPLFYIDENSLQHSSRREIAAPKEGSEKPPVSLRIQISSLSPIWDAVNQQVTLAMTMAESMLQGSELDEIRYWLRDEKLYRFLLTNIISFVHIWVDYLAFRDEVRFYRGKTSYTGVSVSSVVTRFICSVIILLYLMDGGGTSWVVLLSIFGGVAVDGWKMWKLLRPTIVSTFPYVAVRTGTASEQTTARYDQIAITYLAMFLYPLVIGWAIYALKHYKYTSWYSWLISNLANAVYTFGFIGLCPQLYVNYRLKSVAHLPWKVFMYKIFNTFVDDVFAFLIDMPWKHRIMTLRDDVVFVLFLVQVYLYRVDKKRTNEFGYSYADGEVEQERASPVPEKDKEALSYANGEAEQEISSPVPEKDKDA